MHEPKNNLANLSNSPFFHTPQHVDVSNGAPNLSNSLSPLRFRQRVVSRLFFLKDNLISIDSEPL